MTNFVGACVSPGLDVVRWVIHDDDDDDDSIYIYTNKLHNIVDSGEYADYFLGLGARMNDLYYITHMPLRVKLH